MLCQAEPDARSIPHCFLLEILHSNVASTGQTLAGLADRAVVLGFATSSANAQYVNRYSTITSGAVTFTGNTLRLSKGTNTPGTNGSIGTFITNDTSIRDNTYPLGTTADWTKNRSEATLVIPTGATVKYAELIWGGSYAELIWGGSYAHPTGATASAENVKASIDSSGDRSILERAVRQYESFCPL